VHLSSGRFAQQEGEQIQKLEETAREVEQMRSTGQEAELIPHREHDRTTMLDLRSRPRAGRPPCRLMPAMFLTLFSPFWAHSLFM
jgi:hypothetical protein